LTEGFGLVVDDVLPDSPAKTAGLEHYDVLKLLNDQQLVDADQLATLVRGLGKDTEATITFIRKGQEQKAKVKISEKMLPERKPGALFGELQRRFGGSFPGAGQPPQPGGDKPRENAAPPMQEQFRRFQDGMRRYQEQMRRFRDQLQEWRKTPTAEMPEIPQLPELAPPAPPSSPVEPANILREVRPGGPAQVQVQQSDGISTFKTNRARVLMKDSDGEVEVSMKDGHRTLTAKNPSGELVFTGPIETPDQCNAIPEPFRGKLSEIEQHQRSASAGVLMNRQTDASSSSERDVQ